MHSMKELILKGNKCDNEFWSGYFLLLENMLGSKFPGTDLKGEPHINSKIHVWNRQYVCLKNMLGISGAGLNSTTYHVEALPELWDTQIKVDAFTKSLRNMAFPFYSQWGEIFGNDSTNGKNSQLYDDDAINETLHSGVNQQHTSMNVDQEGESSPPTEKCATDDPLFSFDDNSSVTKDKQKGSKRKHAKRVEVQFMDTVGNFCTTSKETFGQIVETMGHITKRVESEYDNHQRREEVYDRLSEIGDISVEVRVTITQYFSNNTRRWTCSSDYRKKQK
ncbi:hypothetical protein ACS0TY_002416 [Phlomoides rotata]